MCNNCSWSDHSLKIDRDRSEDFIHQASCRSKGPPKGTAGDGEAERSHLGSQEYSERSENSELCEHSGS